MLEYLSAVPALNTATLLDVAVTPEERCRGPCSAVRRPLRVVFPEKSFKMHISHPRSLPCVRKHCVRRCRPWLLKRVYRIGPKSSFFKARVHVCARRNACNSPPQVCEQRKLLIHVFAVSEQRVVFITPSSPLLHTVNEELARPLSALLQRGEYEAPYPSKPLVFTTRPARRQDKPKRKHGRTPPRRGRPLRAARRARL